MPWASTKSQPDRKHASGPFAAKSETTTIDYEPASSFAARRATIFLEKPETKAAEKPAAEPDVEVAEKSAAKPEMKAVEKPAAKPEMKVAEKSAAKPAVKAAEKPAAKPEMKVAEKPVTPPVPPTESKPAAKPAPAAPANPPAARPEIPKTFTWDYTFEPEPGRRVWQLDNKSVFVETYPSGKKNRFKIVGPIKVENIPGTLTQYEGSSLQAFVPDKGNHPMYLKMRGSETQPWNHMGEISNIDSPIP